MYIYVVMRRLSLRRRAGGTAELVPGRPYGQWARLYLAAEQKNGMKVVLTCSEACRSMIAGSGWATSRPLRQPRTLCDFLQLFCCIKQ